MSNPTLEEEILLRGYDKEPEILIPDQSIIEISHILDTPYLEYLPIPKDTLKNTKNSTISFYETFFKLQRVPFYVEKKYGPFKIEKQGDIHPFALPIKREKDVDEFFGSLNEVIFMIEPYKTIYYKSLSLPKNITEVTKLAYTHEIAHSQLNHVRGLIQEFYNTEVVSIFLELVHALELNDGEYLLSAHDSIRLTELKSIIDELDKYHSRKEEPEIKKVLIEGSLYLQSTLQAYNLFIRYYYGNINTKKELLQGIQRLFNQELTLEELLSSLDISYENSIKPQELKKYITR